MKSISIVKEHKKYKTLNWNVKNNTLDIINWEIIEIIMKKLEEK